LAEIAGSGRRSGMSFPSIEFDNFCGEWEEDLRDVTTSFRSPIFAPSEN
jgi:hypothetical protein